MHTSGNAEYEKEVSVKEIKITLNSVDGRKATGPEKIHPKVLKKPGPEALNCLFELFIAVWFRSIAPQIWKTADIRPIPKKGKDQRDDDSFHPISLTSVAGKLMEKMRQTSILP